MTNEPNNICRACLQTGLNMKDLFLSDDLPKLDSMLLSTTQVQAYPSDGFPNQICGVCVEKLYSSYSFKTMCQESDNVLKKSKHVVEFDGDIFNSGDNHKEGNENKTDNEPLTASVKLEYSSDENDASAKYNSDSGDNMEDISCDVENINENGVNISKNESSKRTKRLVRKQTKFNCLKCLKKFTNSRDHKSHFCDRIRYCCKHCSKSYVSTDKLDRHVKRFHKNRSVNLVDRSQPVAFEADTVEIEAGTIEISHFIKIKEENIDDDQSESVMPTCEELSEDVKEYVESMDIRIDDKLDMPMKKKKETRGRKKKLIKKSKNLEKTKFKCLECSRKFHAEIYMINHMAKKHSVGKVMFGCNACQQMFPTKVLCANHRRKVHKKEYICDVCSKKFRDRYLLVRHLEGGHPLVPQFKCKKCFRKSFFTQEELDKHTKANVHEVKRPNFICGICNKGFQVKYILKRHIKKLHTVNKSNTHECLQCFKTFLTKWDLRLHLKKHQNYSQQLCSECGSGFTSLQGLRIHMKRHQGDKQHKCQFCDKMFVRMWDKKLHERHHTDEKPHLCNTCGKGFTTAWRLRLHTRTHTGERPYKCTFCNWSAAQSNDLKLHIRRHTGERYTCDLCEESFLQNYLLKNHKLSAHGILEPKAGARLKKIASTN